MVGAEQEVTLPDPHIEIRNLTMAFEDRVLMRDLAFQIQRGEVFIIMGGSGSGKSTLMRHMVGLHDPAAGEICYNGRSFSGAGRGEREQLLRKCGVMYQSGALWSSLTLHENVALPLEQFTTLRRSEIRQIVSYKLSLVGLAGFEEFYPSEISGGMAKRAGVARALALDPEVLYLDEPSAGLDPPSSRRMDRLILELRATLGMTIVVVTHDLESIFEIGTNAVYLDIESRTQGGLGPPETLRTESTNASLRDFLVRRNPEGAK